MVINLKNGSVKMNVTIWSDFVCPFCYIGEAHLAQALAELDFGEQVEIDYKSFLLNPEAKYDDNKSYLQSLADDKGMPLEQAKEMTQRVVDMGQAAGLAIDFEQAKYAPTQDAHRVFQYAKENGKGNEYFERFYQAYFTQGENLGEAEVIVKLSKEVGLDEEVVRSILASEDYQDAFYADIQQAQMIGVQGVPFFVLANKYAVSGAQPTELFKEALTQAWQEQADA